MLQVLILAASTTIAGPAHQNLIINGAFSAGDKGFTTEYMTGKDIQNEGYCSVTLSPSECHPGGENMGDHTNGKGLMLAVNGASAKPNIAFWQETIKVQPNHKYVFGVWGASWSHSAGEHSDTSPARLVVRINGVAINKPFPLVAADAVWTKLVANWNSGTAKTAVIRIEDDNLDGFGNDFAVDDIVFHEK